MNQNEGQSLKQVALIAWHNATNTRTLSPLMTTIGEAIAAVTDDDRTFKAAFELDATAKRIANADKEHRFGCNIAALDYTTGWRGEWEVRNSDLSVFGDFLMWLGRYATADHHNPDVFTDKLRHALRVKRTQQAYDRFQKTGLTPEHCALIAKALWQFAPFRGDGVSLYVQGKRPFGDSGVASSIYTTLGWPYPAEDRALTDDEKERAWNIFDELCFALPALAADYANLRENLTLNRYSHDEIEAACGGETALAVREGVMNRRAAILAESK